MGLGLNTGGGDGAGFGKIIKFDARAGRMFRVDREQDASGKWETDNVEITGGFKAVFDLENIEVGYARFAAGSAPDFKMVKIGTALPAPPTPDHKQGFRINLKLDAACGGDVRELASCAKAVIAAISDLHDQYEKALKEDKTLAGKLPVIVMTGSTAAVSGQGAQKSTNYAPNFAIKSWVKRPADLSGAVAEEDDFPAKDALPKGGAKHVAAPVSEEDDSFG